MRFSEQNQFLAICFGIQSLNVFLGGTLVQDIPSELRDRYPNMNGKMNQEARLETFHSGSEIEPDSQARISGAKTRCAGF